MDNYNPRQNTRMRFKDERELEKYLFLSAEFDFNYETIENASKNYPYNLLVNEIKNIKNITRPCLIYDITQKRTFVGHITSDTIELTTQYSNKILQISMTYDDSSDILSIFTADEEILSPDNVKTIFGQHINGHGNIDLYRHDLVIKHNRTSYDDTQYDLYLTYYSKVNLQVNTPDKLETLTHALNGTRLRGTVLLKTVTGSDEYDKISTDYIGVVYNGSVWNIMNLNGNSIGVEINDVSDTVSSI